MSSQLSILIPTLGREGVLIDTIRALAAQTVRPFEIVVVDQNQPPLAAVDRALAAEPLVRHIRSPRTGYIHNCNVALREARGDLVLYLDDDIIPEPDLVERHLANYSDPTVTGVAGRVEQPSGDRDPATIREVGRYHPWKGKVSANFNARERMDVDCAPGGNMSFRKAALEAQGGWDNGFEGNGYYGETDLVLRVGRAGNRIVFDPTASIKHLAAPMGGVRLLDKSRHTYFFIKNGIRLSRRHSPALALPLIVARMATYALAKSVYNRDPRIFFRSIRAIPEGLGKKLDVQLDPA